MVEWIVGRVDTGVKKKLRMGRIVYAKAAVLDGCSITGSILLTKFSQPSGTGITLELARGADRA